MSGWLRTWMPLVGTFALLGVTTWYAVLTQRLARSSERAASSAREAAEHSAKAAAASVASIPIDFDIRPWYTGFYLGVYVAGAGSTVFVHGVTLHEVRYHKYLTRPNGDVNCAGTRRLALDEAELATPEGVTLPHRLHRNEFLLFPQVDLGQPREDEIAGLTVTVHYSLLVDGEVMHRRIQWIDDDDRTRTTPVTAAPAQAASARRVSGPVGVRAQRTRKRD